MGNGFLPHLPAQQEDLAFNFAGKVEETNVDVLHLHANGIDFGQRILGTLLGLEALGFTPGQRHHVDERAAVQKDPVTQRLLFGLNFFWHTPKYAVAQLCPTKLPTPAGAAPVCDPLQDVSYAVLSYDYGSLRQPVVFQFWIPSVLLFGLSLLGLHWYETDERKKKKAALAPVPTPTPSA